MTKALPRLPNYMLRQTNVPQTISVSHAGNEQTIPPNYAKSVCDFFAQLGARGVSLPPSKDSSGAGGADRKKNDGSGVCPIPPLQLVRWPLLSAKRRAMAPRLRGTYTRNDL